MSEKLSTTPKELSPSKEKQTQLSPWQRITLRLLTVALGVGVAFHEGKPVLAQDTTTAQDKTEQVAPADADQWRGIIWPGINDGGSFDLKKAIHHLVELTQQAKATTTTEQPAPGEQLSATPEVKPAVTPEATPTPEVEQSYEAILKQAVEDLYQQALTDQTVLFKLRGKDIIIGEVMKINPQVAETKDNIAAYINQLMVKPQEGESPDVLQARLKEQLSYWKPEYTLRMLLATKAAYESYNQALNEKWDGKSPITRDELLQIARQMSATNMEKGFVITAMNVHSGKLKPIETGTIVYFVGTLTTNPLQQYLELADGAIELNIAGPQGMAHAIERQSGNNMGNNVAKP